VLGFKLSFILVIGETKDPSGAAVLCMLPLDIRRSLDILDLAQSIPDKRKSTSEFY
jgi:hypothetical protein